MHVNFYLDRVKRIWYLSPMRVAKVQASLRIRAVSPEPSLLAHTSSEPRGTLRQKARSLGPLNDWACAVKMCHDGMLEDTNSLDEAHLLFKTKLSINKYIRVNDLYKIIYICMLGKENLHEAISTRLLVSGQLWFTSLPQGGIF